MKLQKAYFYLTICGSWKLMKKDSTINDIFLTKTGSLFDCETEKWKKPVMSVLNLKKNTFSIDGELSMYDTEVLQNLGFKEIKR